MSPKVNKGKGLASSSHGSKRARTTSEEDYEYVSMAPSPLRQYGLRWVTEKEGKKWFKEHKESKYSHDMFIGRNCLLQFFPHMVDRILTLGLGFMFNAPGDCNLNMVRKLLANLIPKERSNKVKIRGQIILFAPKALNRVLGTPNVDPQPFVYMVKKPLYRNIRHILCGPNSVARWARHQQLGYHVSLPYAHLSREARVWLKIVCACLVPEKYVTHVIRERVYLVYALMTGIPINAGVLIKNVLKRSRVKKGQNFGFGGLLTRFLWGHCIEEDEVDYRPAYDLTGLRMNYVTKEQLQQLNIDYALSEPFAELRLDTRRLLMMMFPRRTRWKE
ncbi:hypothetical protein HAX54_023065 [Datura stramonium]|uniref:Putative plant transposon protein domain-containing protein n=1 Tax=Datura stramonium TaxID=4076 RepID=A0ABS8UVJ1_DATST|nr:hypothetical protein [Datura stramonium]